MAMKAVASAKTQLWSLRCRGYCPSMARNPTCRGASTQILFSITLLENEFESKAHPKPKIVLQNMYKKRNACHTAPFAKGHRCVRACSTLCFQLHTPIKASTGYLRYWWKISSNYRMMELVFLHGNFCFYIAMAKSFLHKPPMT